MWLGRTGDDRFPRIHFDTHEVVVPGQKGGNLTEVNGKFDRQYHDREPGLDFKGPRPTPQKPGEYSLFWVERGKGWDCRLVIKKGGKVLSDTGYFRAVLDPSVDI